jgi:hypothetical protein
MLVSSETSALKAETPGDYPKDTIRHSTQGESFKSRFPTIFIFLLVFFFFFSLSLSLSLSLPPPNQYLSYKSRLVQRTVPIRVFVKGGFAE